MNARRHELLNKLSANSISRVEAVELNDILLQEKAAAEKKGDFAVLIAIILGLALLAAIQARSK